MSQNRKIVRFASALCFLPIVFALTASAQSISRSDLGSAFQVHYGTVERIERVRIQSQAGQGAVMGGLVGGATSGHHHRGKHAIEGDCVTVELGRTANIRRTSSVHCEFSDHEALAEPIVHAKRQAEAAECHAAKQMALQATTKEATDIAPKKVRVFCEG